MCENVNNSFIILYKNNHLYGKLSESYFAIVLLARNPAR